MCKVCGRAPEDGGHDACIEMYSQSMRQVDDASVPPARIDVACEPVLVRLIAVCARSDVSDDVHSPFVHLKAPFKVPIA